jgi:predicted nuclease of predicted toxin-antitoxin system
VKLLFDNNLSVLLPEAVAAFFPGSKHVAGLALEQLSDLQIWQYAKEHHFTIVTKDKDFYHLATSKGSPPKVVWITRGNCTNRQLIDLVTGAAQAISRFMQSNKDILVLP